MSAFNWVSCSIITIILSLLFLQTLGFLVKAAFFFSAKKYKNVMIAKVGQYVSFIYNLIFGMSVWFKY
jgi:hypothetical protein